MKGIFITEQGKPEGTLYRPALYENMIHKYSKLK